MCNDKPTSKSLRKINVNNRALRIEASVFDIYEQLNCSVSALLARHHAIGRLTVCRVFRFAVGALERVDGHRFVLVVDGELSQRG